MSLRSDYTAIKDYKNVCYTTADEDVPFQGIKAGDRILHPVTKALVFLTMGIDMGQLTEETRNEFAARVKLWEKLNGAMVTDYDSKTDTWTPRPITDEDIDRHLGLSTNVGYRPRAGWLQHMFEMATDHRELEPGHDAWVVTAEWGYDYEEVEVTAESELDAISKARGVLAEKGFELPRFGVKFSAKRELDEE